MSDQPSLARLLAYHAEVPVVEVAELLSSHHMQILRTILGAWGDMAADCGEEKSTYDYLVNIGLTPAVARWVCGQPQTEPQQTIAERELWEQLPLPDELLPWTVTS
jgi:hypothetical protein